MKKYPVMRCNQEEQQQQVGIAAAVGVAGIGASIYGAVSSANATKSAASSAAQSQADANAQNLLEYNQSRGSTGSAVLPTYLTNPNGSGTFEQSLGSDLISAYNGSNVPLSSFQSATAPLAPATAAANRFTNDIFNGGITNTLLGEAAPVEAATLSGARQSSMDALNKTLAAIDAAQAGKGFSGDSYGNRMLKFQANKTQGDAVSAANIANLAQNQQIENYGNVTNPQNNLSLPGTMATMDTNMAFAPQAGYLNSLNQRIQPFDFLKLGAGNPPSSAPLPVAPASQVGGTISATGGALTSGALQYYLNQQNANNASNLAAFNANSSVPNVGSASSFAASLPSLTLAPPASTIPAATSLIF